VRSRNISLFDVDKRGLVSGDRACDSKIVRRLRTAIRMSRVDQLVEMCGVLFQFFPPRVRMVTERYRVHSGISLLQAREAPRFHSAGLCTSAAD